MAPGALGAPSGQITADPEVVFVPSGGQGKTLISWTTTNCANAQVTVQSAGGEEQTFVEATSWKNASAPWIGLNSYTFRLYGDLTRTLLLDSVVVTGVPAPTGSISASPRTFTLATSDGTFSTTLSWTTSGGTGGWVTQAVGEGEEQLIGQGGSNAGLEVSGLGVGQTVFRLYGDENRTMLLDSVTVTGNPPSPGSLAVDPSVFTLAAPEATFSTRLSWTTRDDSGGWVTQAAGEGEEQLIGQGGSNAGMEVSGLGAGRTVFRLYGDEALTQLLDSIETAGTVSPLTVQSDGALRLNNRPFTGVGVNYYSAFERVLDKSSDTTCDAGFEALGRWGVPFARLDISGYWPVKLNLFFTNRVEYFRRLDGVVASAERHGVGLIPSLFWTTFAIPDLAGERHDQMAVSNSVTRQMMREFATEIVNRYKDSRAIWAWEFSNEWNLAVDIPNYTDFLPTDTSRGNPATRDPVLDLVATDTILPAMVEIATLIKSLDPGRPLSTGHAMSRPFQWHLDQWRRGLIPIDFVYNDDSPAQAEEIALRHCPDPFDLLSIHVYGAEPPRVGDFAGFAARAGKALFVGEFGTPPDSEANYAAMLTAVRTHSPLAAVWVFDRPKPRDEYNITTTNSRSWMLRELLPATFESWSRGYGASEIPGDGQTAFGQYVFGAAFPGGAVPPSNGGMSNEFLELTAVVRTNDPSVSVFGQTADSLLPPGSWSSAGVQQADFSDQTDVLPGCARRTFRVSVSSDFRKFLRIRAEGP